MTTTTPTPNPPISSEQARRLVDRFLLMEVSTMLAAATPELVFGARPIWRVPVWIGFLHQGRYTVCTLDVDAQSGALLEREQGAAAMRARAGEITLQRMQTSTDLPGCCGVTGLSVAVSIRCSLFP
jgi:hypothetical protein